MRESIHAEHYIAFDARKYDSLDKMFDDVKTTLKILIQNDYQCAFRYEDCDIYILEYDSDNPELGSPMIYWLDNDQLDCLYSSQYLGEDEENDEE